MILIALYVAILLSAIGYLWMIRRSTIGSYLLKPGTMILIITLALVKMDGGFSFTWDWWIITGLVLSLLGDIFLMLPSDRFLAGLVAFFAAHVAYIIGFISAMDRVSFSKGIGAIILVLAVAYFFLLQKGVRAKGGISLQIAVFSYVLVISSMVYLAIISGNSLWIAGALLFYLSDAILGWDRFKEALTYRHIMVMVPYYLAQFLFAMSLG